MPACVVADAEAVARGPCYPGALVCFHTMTFDGGTPTTPFFAALGAVLLALITAATAVRGDG